MKEVIDVSANKINTPPIYIQLIVFLEDVLDEETQTFAGLIASPAVGMSFSMEMPRKRKSSIDNQ